MTNTIFTFGGCNPYDKRASALIELKQSSRSNALFTVSYGLQVKAGLTYAQASKELGECIFHHLANESLLNNEGL